MKIYVVYDSESHHTEALAESIVEGARRVEGAQVYIHHVDDADVNDLVDMDAIIWGCPGHSDTLLGGTVHE